MEPEKLRRKICFAAAQLLYSRRENSFAHARWRAARAITRSYIESDSLPTDMEIRAALQALVHDASSHAESRGGHDFENHFSTVHPVSNVHPAAGHQPSGSDHAAENAFDETDTPNLEDVLPANRFSHYLSLLLPLDRVHRNRQTHPEGDVLYHSLQVFEMVRDAIPYDEDLLTAAILHDVGLGIDPFDAAAATLDAVSGWVSERTFWLIENLPLQHRVFDGTIGIRARRRLSRHESSEELNLLANCDTAGRVPGRIVCSAEEAILCIRELASAFD